MFGHVAFSHPHMCVSFALPKDTCPERNWLPLRHKRWHVRYSAHLNAIIWVHASPCTYAASGTQVSYCAWWRGSRHTAHSNTNSSLQVQSYTHYIGFPTPTPLRRRQVMSFWVLGLLQNIHRMLSEHVSDSLLLRSASVTRIENLSTYSGLLV